MKVKALTLALLLATTVGYAQQQTANRYEQYLPIIEKGTLVQKDSLAKALLAEVKGYKTETDYHSTINILRSLDKENEMTIVENIAKKKYPKGAITRDAFITDVFYNAGTSKEKEKAYTDLIKKWPVKNFSQEPLTYDYVLANLSQSFANDGNAQKAIHYLGEMKERFWRGNGYIPVGQILLKSGDTTTAAPLLKTAMDDSYYYLTLPEEQKDNKARFAAMGYASSMSAYVNILVAQKKNSLRLSNISKMR